jgi:hypothetical protein
MPVLEEQREGREVKKEKTNICATSPPYFQCPGILFRLNLKGLCGYKYSDVVYARMPTVYLIT